jgi:hypothetical protein
MVSIENNGSFGLVGIAAIANLGAIILPSSYVLLKKSWKFYETVTVHACDRILLHAL